MRSVKLGSQGLEVSRIGLGCMGMSQSYGDLPPFEQCRDTLLRAVELGITLFDTADIYGAAAALYGQPGPGFGHNERLLAKILEPHYGRVTIATRFGACLNEEGKIAIDGRPQYVRKACEASLARLGTDRLDLYIYTRLDPTVPIEETVGALGDLVKAGKVGYIGLSEMSGDTLRRAHAVHPITALESEYSLWARQHETGSIAACRELGVGFLAFSPLGRAMLTGALNDNRHFVPTDFRTVLPKFQGDNFERNRRLVAQLAAMANARGVRPSQLALAWILAQADFIVPIPGTKRIAFLEENICSLDIRLTPAETADLSGLFDPAAISGEALSNQHGGKFIDR
jgi:aryl-alcohol dehydrogenase-like predicted oxidoreductase